MHKKIIRSLIVFLAGVCTCIVLQDHINALTGRSNCALSATAFPSKFKFTVPYQESFLYSGYSHDYMDAVLLGCKAWEAGIIKTIEDVLVSIKKKQNTASPVNVFDVGAHRGTHTLVYSQVADTVFAIDPNPMIFDDLQENLKQNKIKNVIALQVGLGDSDGVLDFILPGNWHTGLGSFIKTPDFSNNPKKVQAKLVRGDTLVEEYELEHLQFIKIDVEGFEKAVLEGFAASLKRFRPIVFVEYTPNVEGNFSSLSSLVQSFPSDYRFFQVIEEAPEVQSARIQNPSSDTTEQVNLLAVATEQVALLPEYFHTEHLNNSKILSSP